MTLTKVYIVAGKNLTVLELWKECGQVLFEREIFITYLAKKLQLGLDIIKTILAPLDENFADDYLLSEYGIEYELQRYIRYNDMDEKAGISFLINNKQVLDAFREKCKQEKLKIFAVPHDQQEDEKLEAVVIGTKLRNPVDLETLQKYPGCKIYVIQNDCKCCS